MREGDIIAGKYRVDKTLGQGGMGIVLAATHVELGQRVAIKIMHPELAEDANAVARFSREGQAAARLRSAHVARVLDVGRLDGGAPYLVLEYLEGRDLSAVVSQNGPLRVEEAVVYLMQACEALAEAHAAGITHRDLKPANLFLTEDAYGSPSIKVLDFGISKITSESQPHGAMTATSVVMGSPLYMPPEQMRSTRSADARSDIWALGAIFYELVTGQPVWSGDTFSEICVKVISDPTPSAHSIRPELVPAVDAVVSRCLEKDPAKRFQSVAELAVRLVELGGPECSAMLTRVYRLSGLGEPPQTTPANAVARKAPETRAAGGGPATASEAATTGAGVPDTAVSWGSPTHSFTRAPSAMKWVIAALLVTGAGAGVAFWISTRHGPSSVTAASSVPGLGAASDGSDKVASVAKVPVQPAAPSSIVPAPPPVQPASPEIAATQSGTPVASAVPVQRPLRSPNAKRAASSSEGAAQPAGARGEPKPPTIESNTTAMPNWGGRR